MIVLGIDQGLANVGYAVIDYDSADSFSILKSGAIRTKAKDDLSKRMNDIFSEIDKIIEIYDISHMGCEKFFFNKSDKTLEFRSSTIVKTNMVTGLLFLLAHKHSISIKEFVPGTIKKHVTGNGRASKEAMIYEINSLCKGQGFQKEIKNDHEADAIGIGLKVGHDAKKTKED